MSGQLYTKYGKTCRNKQSSKSSSESDSKDKSNKPKKDVVDEDEITRKDTGSASSMGEDADEAGGRKGTAPATERRKSSVLSHADVHPVDDRDEDSEPYRKSSSRGKDRDALDELDAGAESDDEGDAEDVVQGSDEKFTEFDDEGDESGAADGGDDDDEEDAGKSDEYDQDEGESEEIAEDDESVEEEESDDEKKRRKGKGALEYDIGDMYPEINILIQKKKREWDFQDPDIIRAIWLETRTQALSEWKVRNAKINIDKPSFEVRDTMTVTMRQEYLNNKAELQQALQEREFEMTEASRDPPHFDSIQLATNLTTDMRYKFNRNNPPVPSHYIEHFEKFKKPPFKNNSIWYIHS